MINSYKNDFWISAILYKIWIMWITVCWSYLWHLKYRLNEGPIIQVNVSLLYDVDVADVA